MKKFISIILSVLLIAGCCTTAFSAAGNDEEPTFKYVALGDSIAAGFGLNVDETGYEPTMVLTEDLINNPIEGAYPAVFGRYLEEIGAGKNVGVKATNLSTSGYTSADLAAVITTEGYVGQAMYDALPYLIGDDSGEILEKYHDIMVPYLEEADMISIEIGANDIMFTAMNTLAYNDNPLITALMATMSMMMAGYGLSESIAIGTMVLQMSDQEITLGMVTDAINSITGISNDLNASAEAAAANVAELVDELREINSDADIVLVNYFNPYGNSFEYNGQRYDFASVSARLILQLITNAMRGNPKDLRTILTDELSYPLQYLTLGKLTDQSIKLLNAGLLDIANEKGCAYVDVYDISNDLSMDPHPSAEQHVEMADRMLAVLSDRVNDVMDDMSGSETILGDADCDGSVTAMDATVIQRYVVEIKSAKFNAIAADVDNDDMVTVVDATMIQRWLAGMLRRSDIGKPID